MFSIFETFFILLKIMGKDKVPFDSYFLFLNGLSIVKSDMNTFGLHYFVSIILSIA